MYRPVKDPEQIEKLIQFQFDVMDSMDCPQVDMDEILAGDHGSLREAMAQCGFPMNENLVNEFVDQSRWHHR